MCLRQRPYSVPRYVYNYSEVKPIIQYCAYLNSNYFRSRCGCTPVPVNLNFVVISPYFAIFKNVVHSLESELLGVSPGSKLCAMFLNIAKYFKTLRCGCGAVAFIFSIYLKPVLYIAFGRSSAFESRRLPTEPKE